MSYCTGNISSTDFAQTHSWPVALTVPVPARDSDRKRRRTETFAASRVTDRCLAVVRAPLSSVSARRRLIRRRR